jgi:hypothetical protein
MSAETRLISARASRSETNQIFRDFGVSTPLTNPARWNWRNVLHMVALETWHPALKASS